MKKIILAIASFLMAMMFISTANATTFTITGRLKYTRSWHTDNLIYNGSGSLMPSSQRDGAFSLKDVQVCFMQVIPAGAFTVYCNNTPNNGSTIGFTADNGVFQTTITAPQTSQYLMIVKFAGRDTSLSGLALGYRVVATAGDTLPLTAALPGLIQGGAEGATITLADRTFLPCTPTSATCANDYANGHQVVQWAVQRMRALGMTAPNVPLFEKAAGGLVFYTDRDPNLQCGFSSCFNFDFGVADMGTGWHEFGHQIIEKITNAKGTGNFGNFPGQNPCPSDAVSNDISGGNLIGEGAADLSSLMMAYSEADVANLANFNGYCASFNDPSTDNLNNCQSCEFQPNLASYPKPITCGVDPHNNVRRTECRALKTLIDLIDDKPVNGTGCLSESVNLSYAQLINYLTSMPTGNGTTEGSTHENTIGGTAIGTASSTIDAFTMMDFLKSIPGVTESQKYIVWANACYMPGEAGWSTGTFLPAGGQDNAPF